MTENPSFFELLRRTHPALTREEKEHMLLIIRRRMEQGNGSAGTSFIRRIGELFRAFHYAPIAASFFLLVGAGATAATAEDALPGDFLYPMKIHVNEVVLSNFSFSASKRARWAMRRVERRLEEAATLAERRMDNGAREQVVSTFGSHVARVEHHIRELESKGRVDEAEALSARFESSLAAHEEVIAALEQSDDTVRTAIGLMAAPEKSDVRQEIAKHREALARKKFRADRLEESVQMNIRLAETALAEVRAIGGAPQTVESTMMVASDAEPTISSEKLRLADETLSDARMNLRAGKYDEALSKAKSALRDVESARLFLRRGDRKLPRATMESYSDNASQSSSSVQEAVKMLQEELEEHGVMKD